MGFFSKLFGGKPKRATWQNPRGCPACQQPLQSLGAVFQCQACQGFWIPELYFGKLLAQADEQVAPMLDTRPPGPQTLNPSTSPRQCACCEAAMDNYQFACESGIWIDACPHGHGMWLDPGEFAMIRSFRSGEGPSVSQTLPQAFEGDPYREAFLRSVADAMPA